MLARARVAWASAALDPAIQPLALCLLKVAEDNRAALQVVAEQTMARIPLVVNLVDSADHLAVDLADSAALRLVMAVDPVDIAALPLVMAVDLEAIRVVMAADKVDPVDIAALPLVMAALPLVMAVDPVHPPAMAVDPVDKLVLAAARQHRSRDAQEVQSLRLGRCSRRLLHDLLSAKLLLQAKQKCTASRKMFRIACSRIPRRQ